MPGPEVSQLSEELKQFAEDRENIRNVIGQIGGQAAVKREKTITLLLVLAVLVLFVMDITRHYIGLPIPLPPLFSMEIGILLVSLKIIMMVHSLTRVEHFQFWMLNSIYYRVNELSRNVRQIRERLDDVKDD